MNNLAHRFTREEDGSVKRIGGAGATNSGLLARFAADDGAQDLVEYALLAAFIGLAGWAIVTTLPDVMRTTYESWMDPTGGVPGQWDPPEPAGS
jgi:Flp pilus assembly pilin Flp